MYITVRLMISYSDLHLCCLGTAFLSSKNFTWATVQCKMVQVICTKFISNYKHFSVFNIHQLSGLYHCLPSPPPSMTVVERKQLNEGVYTRAWTSCSGYILYNWPLKMHTSTIDARMIKANNDSNSQTTSNHYGTTGIQWAAGRTVCRQWRTTQSLWIEWRNVHWVGGTHTITTTVDSNRWLY